MRRIELLGIAGAAACAGACSAILGLGDPALDNSIGSDASSDTGLPDALSPDGPEADAFTGGDADAGPATPIAVVPGIRPWGLAVDGTHVFWTEPLVNRVGSADADGTNVVYLASGTSKAGARPFILALDATDVFWNTNDDIRKCAKTGCGGTASVLTPTATSPFAVAVDAAHVYWIATAPDSIYEVAKTGGSESLVVALPSPGDAITIDSGFAYITMDDGSVAKLDLTSNKLAIITPSSSPAPSFELAVGSGFVYYTQFADPGVVSYVSTAGYDAGGGGPLALNQRLPFGIALNSTDVYWAELGGLFGPTGKIVTCSLASCVSPKELATAQNIPKLVALDTGHVYWTNYGNASTNDDGAVMRLAIK